MSKAFGLAFAVALMVIAFVVWRGFETTKGNHLEPVGKIGKVRTLKVDENEVIMVLDFNLRNDSDQEMVVRSVEADLDAADGTKVAGKLVAAADLANVFRNYKELGDEFNAPMKVRDSVKARDAVDRMVGFRFDVPEETVARRKDVVLRVEDITGPIAEMTGR